MSKTNSVELSTNELFQNDLVIWYTQGNQRRLFSSNPIIELYIVQSYCPKGTDNAPDTKQLIVEIATQEGKILPNTVYVDLSIGIKTGDAESLERRSATLTSGQKSWEIRYNLSDSSVFIGTAYFEGTQLDFTDGEAYYSFAERSFEEGTKPTQKTTISSINYIDYLANNILGDFANGVKQATITLSCSDFYDENGKKIKQWANGDIVNLGDLILLRPRTDMKESFLGRVTGRTFKHEGCPFVDLTLQEIKQESLEAPIISIADGVVSWQKVNNATQYYVYCDSKEIATINDSVSAQLSINLANLITDFAEHQIYVVAGGIQYSNSPQSNIVNYTNFNVIDNGDGTITILNASVAGDGSVLIVGDL